MNLTPIYISAGANRSPNCLSWLEDTLIFGCSNAVVLAAKEKGVFVLKETLVGHSDRVNCVQWINPSLFVSGSTDKDVILWEKQSQCSFSPKQVLKGHEKSVIAVSALERVGDCPGLIIASTSGDSTIRVWNVTSGGVDQDVIHIPRNGYAMNVKLCSAKSNVPILFAPLDDCKIHIYSKNGEGQFTSLHSLDGHDGWVHGLDIATMDSDRFYVASGGQDSFIRVWKVEQKCENKVNSGDLRVKESTIQVGDNDLFTISLETVLSGHEDKVYGVHWRQNEGKLQLLSCSFDKTMLIWDCPTNCEAGDEEETIWMESARLGEVGGNVLGFLGAQFNLSSKSQGLEVAGYSFNGAFHIWRQEEDLSWTAQVPFGGHRASVQDLAWETNGRYYLTLSQDQTTRIHSLWNSQNIWREIARPQVHGYDMTSITTFPGHNFASGAEEKIVRVFHTTKMFLRNLASISNITLNNDDDQTAQGASVPSLGLSNKAVFEEESVVKEEDRHVKDLYPDNYFVPETYPEPPPEESLIQNTLWPETQKLYGHGYEIFCLASNPEGSLISSACKASQAQYAEIILWDTKSWKIRQKLSGPSLTITQMEFSPCGTYLLAVSRDRNWYLYKKTIEAFELFDFTDKKTTPHARIIWTCGWSKDSKYFVTGSRDKKLAIWTLAPDDKGTSTQKRVVLANAKPFVLKDSITAISTCPRLGSDGSYFFAVGYDIGEIELIKWNPNDSPNFEAWSLERNAGHHKTVKRLQFCPDEKDLILATCSSDHSTKLFRCQI